MVQTLEIVLLLSDAVRGRLGLGVALLKVLPEGKAARWTARETETRLSRCDKGKIGGFLAVIEEGGGIAGPQGSGERDECRWRKMKHSVGLAADTFDP